MDKGKRVYLMSKFDLKLSESTIAIDTEIKHDNTMKNGNKITLFLEVFLNVVLVYSSCNTTLFGSRTNSN